MKESDQTEVAQTNAIYILFSLLLPMKADVSEGICSPPVVNLFQSATNALTKCYLQDRAN